MSSEQVTLSEKSVSTTPTQSRFRVPIHEPPVAHWLFADVRSAPFWLVVRVWLGLLWFGAGWEKAMLWDFNSGKWLNNGGVGLKGYWDRALTVPPGGKGALVTYDWYYDFLKFLDTGGHYSWFAWFIALGEMAVGLGLIFGCLTAVAAFFGTLMNFSFELAGTTSTNPVLFGVAIFIILAWRTSGWWGLDRYILPALGTPWERGKIFNRPSKGSNEQTKARGDKHTPEPV